MSGPGGWPGDDTAETQVLALPAAERLILAALSVVGGASLAVDELAVLVDVDDVIPLVEDLERRRFIRRDEKKRYSVLGGVGAQIRKTDDALATGDRLLKYVTTLARGGSLTPDRLVEDAEAILGLSEWAAENRKWLELLELVKTLQASFGIAQRVQEWLTLLTRGRAAAHALADTESEVWVLQQLATASAASGDPSSAQRYRREADQLERGSRASVTREVRIDEAAAAGPGGVPRQALWIAGVVAAAAIGAVIGFVVGDDSGGSGVMTTRVPVTITAPGTTVTGTVTLPASTFETTTTATTTTTVTTTTFVTTTVSTVR